MVPDPEVLPGFAKNLGVQGSLEELCKNTVMDGDTLVTLSLWWTHLMVCFFKEIKKAVLSDLTNIGREAGLKSFEQVMFKYLKIPLEFGIFYKQDEGQF